MAQRVPSPFRPLPAIARDTLPDQRRERVHATFRPDPRGPKMVERLIDRHEVIIDADKYPGESDLVRVTRTHPLLTITADITLPHTPGYARRLGNLLLALRTTVEEHAPWLANVDIEVKR